jgi:hypothetical protein
MIGQQHQLQFGRTSLQASRGRFGADLDQPQSQFAAVTRDVLMFVQFRPLFKEPPIGPMIYPPERPAHRKKLAAEERTIAATLSRLEAP